MGREIRRVPKDWEHPRDEQGHYRPVYDKDYATARQEWLDGLASWLAGATEVGGRHADKTDYWEWEGNPPDRGYYRPAFESAECFQVYENVSEGTPVSPVFDTQAEVIDWLIGQGHSRDAAEEFIRIGSAPSFLIVPGLGILKGIDGLALEKSRAEEGA